MQLPQCTTLHTGVGKWLHTLPSHPTWGEPQGFSWWMPTNQPQNAPSTVVCIKLMRKHTRADTVSSTAVIKLISWIRSIAPGCWDESGWFVKLKMIIAILSPTHPHTKKKSTKKFVTPSLLQSVTPNPSSFFSSFFLSLLHHFCLAQNKNGLCKFLPGYTCKICLLSSHKCNLTSHLYTHNLLLVALCPLRLYGLQGAGISGWQLLSSDTCNLTDMSSY